MKRILCSAVAVMAAVLLCSCESVEQRSNISVQLINIDDNTESAEARSDENSDAPQEDISAEIPDVGGTEVAASEPPAEEVSEPAEEGGSHSATEETSAPSESEIVPIPDEASDSFYMDVFAAYNLSPEEREFTKHSIFVGDSICRGYAVYDVVDGANVFARGSVAARNFYEYKFYHGEDEVDFATALEISKPEFVFLSMGMNDINITDEATYCENYRVIIEQALQQSEAEIYVSAITPINSEFSSNYRIDCFNLAMQKYIDQTFSERVHFVDFAKHLKDADGNLKDCFNGGDGIHLSPYAYYVALWEINRQTKYDGVR